MPQAQDLVSVTVTDTVGNETSQSFELVAKQPVATYVDKTHQNPVLRPSITMSASRGHKDRIGRSRSDIRIPLVRTVDGEEKSLGDCFARIDIKVPADATELERLKVLRAISGVAYNFDSDLCNATRANEEIF